MKQTAALGNAMAVLTWLLANYPEQFIALSNWKTDYEVRIFTKELSEFDYRYLMSKLTAISPIGCEIHDERNAHVPNVTLMFQK